MTNKELFLETADKIANRLIESALWNGDNCTWYVNTTDREDPKFKKSIKEIAGGAIYQGTSGISLFLTELSKFTDNKNKILETAEGALKYALEDSEKSPNNNSGFHSGISGIAYSALQFALASGKYEYLEMATQLLKPLSGNQYYDYSWDVIGGAAGAIPILLIMNEYFENDLAFSIALKLGDNLIKKANMEPAGWSWGGGDTNVRNLCGLAHGTAGAGHAFMELYNYTGSSKYLYAAEQAFLYERQFFNEELNNWPDFRYSELSEYIYYDRIEELKTLLREGNFPAYKKKYMSAWCHGSPGIGLTRLRVFEITKNNSYKKEALKAIEETKISLIQNKLTNYSLCHGMGGNSETLIYAHEVFYDEELLKLAENIGLEGIEKYEKNNNLWPCGTMNTVSDPSLMLGEAGIGYFFLRLFDRNVPSVLLPSVRTVKDNILEEDSFKELRKNYINYYFGDTIEHLKEFDDIGDTTYLPHKLKLGGNYSDVENVLPELKKIFAQVNDKSKEFEHDFKIEKLKFEMTSVIDDYSGEYQYELIAKPFDEINFDNTEFCLMPFVKLIESGARQDEDPTEEKDKSFTILYKKQNRILKKELNVFSYLILKTIEQPVSLEKISVSICKYIEIERETEIDSLKSKIKEQLGQFYNSQIIKIINRPLYTTPVKMNEILKNN